MTTEIPVWVTIFERLGPGMGILVFVLATLWKVIPSLLKLMGAWKRQADTVAAAVPRIESSIEKMASGVHNGLQRLEDKFDATKGKASVGSSDLC